MAIRSLADLRRQAGAEWEKDTDEDLISAYAKAINRDPVDVANALGYKPSSAGMTGQRFSSAFDRYQAGLYGLGEAVAGGLGFEGAEQALAARRRANELEAAVASRAAREMGAVESYKDVEGVGSGLNYLTGLAIQSAPYIGEAVVGGLGARALMGGTRAALGTARTAGDVAAATAAERSLGRASLAGAGAASYPSSVGEVLQAQREQAGTTDLGTAAALGVPFAALNTVGIEGALARSTLARSGIEALDALQGVRGGLTRAAASGTKTGLVESAAETAQTGVEQLGRMSVDPNEAFLSPEAIERYKEAAVGGFALGGAFGAGAGGWRRSEQFDLLNRRADGQADAQNQETLQLGYSPLAGTPIVFPDGTVTLSSDQELQARYGIVRPATATQPTVALPIPATVQATPAQQATQQAASQQRAAQEIQEQEYLDTAQRFGLTAAPDRPNTWDIAGKRMYSNQAVQTFINELAVASREKTNDQKALESAVVAAGLVQIKDSGTAKNLISGITRQLEKFQIADAPTVDEAATRLNDQIARLTEQGKGQTDKTVDALARMFESLTGQTAPAFEALQISVPATIRTQDGAQTAQTQQAETQRPQAPAAAAPAAAAPTVTPEARSGLIRQDQGAPAPSATTTLAAPTGATQAQPVPMAERGGAPEVGGTAAPAPTEIGRETWDAMDISGVSYTQLSPEDRAAWDRAAAEGTATGEMQDQLAEKTKLDIEASFAEQILDRVISRVIKSPKKAEYFATYLTTKDAQDRNETNNNLAAYYGVSLETIKDWNKQLQTFLEDKATQLREAFQVVSVELRVEPTELQRMLQEMNARGRAAEAEVQQTLQPDEVVLDTREVISEDGGMTEQTRKGASVQEKYNAPDTINARYINLLQQLEAAENEGNTELVDEISSKLSTLGEQAAKQAGTQSARKAERRGTQAGRATTTKAQKGKKGEGRAVQEQSTTAVSVQPRTRGGEEVGQEVRGAEGPAREGEAQVEGQTQAQEVTSKFGRLEEYLSKFKPSNAQNLSMLGKAQIDALLNHPEFGKFERFLARPTAPLFLYEAEGVPESSIRFHKLTLVGRGNNGEVYRVVFDLGMTSAEAPNLKQRRSIKLSEPIQVHYPGDVMRGGELEGVLIFNEPGSTPAKQAAERFAREEVAETQAQEVALTTAETAEATWNELRSSMPAEIQEAIPTWNNLTPAQQERAMAVGEDLNMRNVEQVMALQDETRTIDVEARVIPDGERRLLENGLKKLPNGQVATLERHYGAKSGTEEFLSKLATDIANYVNKGAESVAAAIRGIIKSMAEGMIAFGLIFNPAQLENDFDFNLPAIYREAEAIKSTVPQNAQAKMSPMAQRVYRDMAATAKETGKGFIIADKQAGMIHAFNADGSLLVQDSALFGKDTGDKLGVSSFRGGKKVTPAGKFTLKAVENPEYAGGYTLQMVETADEDGIVAVHAAYLGDTKEKRLERLASPDAKEKRVSYGCINTTHETFLNKFKPNLNNFDGGMIFVLPEEPVNIAALKEGKTAFDVQKLNFRALVGEPGVESALRSFRELGIEGILDLVDQYQVMPESSASDGQYDVVDGRTILKFKVSALEEGTRYTAHVVRHEFAHVVDEAAKGGVYSAQPQMSMSVSKGKITPVGAVAREVFNLYKTDGEWEAFMSYPFERTEYSAQRMQAEMFAQLWSLYTDPNLRQELMSKAPIASAYMKEVIAHVQRSIPVQLAEKGISQGQAQRPEVRVQGQRTGKGQRVSEQEAAEALAESNLALAGTTVPPNIPTTGRRIGFGRAVGNVQQDVLGEVDTSLGGAFSVQAGQTKSFINRMPAKNQISKLPPIAQGPAYLIWDTVRNLAKKGVTYGAFLSDLSDMAKSVLPSSQTFVRLQQEQDVEKLKFEKKVNDILVAFDKLPANLRGTGEGSVNRFIKDSTLSGRWGYKIRPDSDVTLDPDLEKRFNAFPAAAQKVIRDVFAHGYETLMELKKSIRANINTEFDAQIAAAKETNDDKLVAALEKDRDAALENYVRFLNMAAKGPYAPLSRFGQYVVVGKSKAYRDAEARKDTKELERMQSDERHYFVEFAETFAEGAARQRELEGQYDYVSPPFEKDAARDTLYSGTDLQRVFYRLKNVIKDNLEGAEGTLAGKTIDRMVGDLHLKLLSEYSARQAQNRRRKVAGASDDMMRSFATQGLAMANFLGSLKNTGKIHEAILDMTREASEDVPNKDDRRRYYNEFIKRHAMGYEYNPSPLIDGALAATSGFMLITSPAYILQNLTQPFMLSVPYMAGRHGEGRSMKAMFAAYKGVTNAVTEMGLGDALNYKKLPKDVQAMMEDLVNRGRININLSQDLGGWSSKGEGFTAVGKNIHRKLKQIVEKAEMVNRMSTAVAAFRLAKERGATDEAATNYADEVIRVTHGDYSGANAPRFMRTNMGRLITQFRKFQLIQISMFARLFNQAFRGANPEERAAARQALLWMFTHAGVAGGVMGLPGFAAIAAVWGALFGDEDDPEKPLSEAAMRRYFGDYADMMVKGVPAALGVDVSGKIGAGQMLSILPYTDLELSRSGWEKLLTGAAGPTLGGLAPRMWDGLGQIYDGNYIKGIEQIIPKGLSDAIKAGRVATGGVTLRNNDVVLSPDEISFLDAFGQAIGLPTTTITEQQFRNRTQIENEQFFRERITKLKRDYAKAYRDGDSAGMAEARENWRELQEARDKAGFKRQPLSNLLRSPQEQREREARTVGGVQFNRQSRRAAEELPQ